MEAKLLSLDDNVLEVSVHKWILKDDGTQEHSEDDDSIPYYFLNSDHRGSNSKKMIALINEIVYNKGNNFIDWK